MRASKFVCSTPEYGTLMIAWVANQAEIGTRELASASKDSTSFASERCTTRDITCYTILYSFYASDRLHYLGESF